VSDSNASYLLPCACGREIVVEPRQAGESVRCRCGRDCAVPTLREVRSLRPAQASAATRAQTDSTWGNPQRFLAAGVVVLLLAGIQAVILYRQLPAQFARLPTPEAEAQRVKKMSTVELKVYFHQVILPGIELPERAGNQSKRSMVYLGMASLSVFGAIGLILAGIGIAGIIRRRRAPVRKPTPATRK
jgi:hypothetical protein